MMPYLPFILYALGSLCFLAGSVVTMMRMAGWLP